MKIYMAGKVTGLDYGAVKAKFNEAGHQLKAKGFDDVINPIEICDPAWEHEQCMDRCIDALMTCDAICLLPDWRESPGARLEYDIAVATGRTVIEQCPQIIEDEMQGMQGL
jgi:hypothetical protein